MIHNEQPFYRIHKANLIGFGILPQEFFREKTYWSCFLKRPLIDFSV